MTIPVVRTTWGRIRGEGTTFAVAAYGALVTFGALSISNPSLRIVEVLGPGRALVWAMFLLVGGALGLAGVWHPRFEELGLPLVIAALLVLAGATLYQDLPRPGGLLSLSVALLWMARLRYVRRISRASNVVPASGRP